MAKLVFFIGITLSASGILSPPIALTFGLLYGFILPHPCPADARRLSKILLQASVVGLGFGMNLLEVAKVGRSGFLYTACSITGALALGLLLGRWLQVGSKFSFLITAGTAICGGSAIAAIGPILEATEEEMAVSLGTVFVLNSIALLLFPPLGWAMHLSQTQFGLWSALAIHDTSSVVGATAKYGALAMAIGTVVKLARALWIVPVSLGISILKKTKSSANWPWFIGLFCLAAMANTYAPVFGSAYSVLNHLGRIGLTVTLYLIGTGLSKSTLRQIGIRPLFQGISLWAMVAIGSLVLIRKGFIRL